jgi:hypothetical protein
MDCHHQLCQDLLALQKKWVMQECYFHHTTTLIGMAVADSFLLERSKATEVKSWG